MNEINQPFPALALPTLADVVARDLSIDAQCLSEFDDTQALSDIDDIDSCPELDGDKSWSWDYPME